MGLFDRQLKAGRIDADSSESEKTLAEQDATRLLEEGMALEKQGQMDEALRCYDSAIHLMPELARAHFNRGNILLERGDAQEALLAYTKAVQHKPDSAAAHYNMGTAHLNLGEAVASVDSCRLAIALKPDFADAHMLLGMALEKLGQHESAVECFSRVIDLKPDFAEAYFQRGISFHALGMFDDAVSSYRRALGINPDLVEAHYNEGVCRQSMGEMERAEVCYRKMLEIDADHVFAHNNLGGVLGALGQFENARACVQQALVIRPDFAEAHVNLGNVLQAQGQIDAAAASYRRALEIKPDLADAHSNYGLVWQYLEKFDLAEESYRRALELNPALAIAHNNLGIVLSQVRRFEDSIASYRRAIAAKADNAEAYANLGSVLKDVGRLDESIASLRRALELDPDCVIAHHNLLFIHNYMADQPAELLVADARRFGDMAARLARPYTDWPNRPDSERRLRVGFVSGDLCSHPVGYFLESVLGALSSQASDRLELYAYPTRVCDDVTSQRIQACCRGWHLSAWLSDEALARRIRDDGIDILIDLSGHTGHNRLPLFAWKPAPVQVSWLGYFATTGVTAMDYFIADPWTLPPDQEAYFTEQIWRLPETRLCFTPPDAKVTVSPLPALSNGYITFGCFNNLSKMTDAVVALWAQVLNKVPSSRLFLKYQQFAEASVRQRTCERFAIHGIDSKRLTFEDYTARESYLSAYHRVDIALDPFPFPGGTTTVEALWMGVPVLTLAGDRFLARQGVGLLMNAGLPEWVATDPDDYVTRAVAHASDRQRLATLRAGLRQQVLASSIFDAPRFAHHFEAALRGMWQKWCAQNAGVRPPTDKVRNGAI